jgi:AraC-like DNA-binding protein
MDTPQRLEPITDVCYCRGSAIASYAHVARSAELSPVRMISAAGLPDGCLDEPDWRLPAGAIVRLLEESAHVSRIEDFGVRMAEVRNFSALGVMGLVLREQPTLRRVLAAASRFMRLETDSILLRIEESGEIAIITAKLNAGASGSARQATEHLVGVLCRSFRMLLQADWRPTAVCFSHDAPKSFQAHRRLFGSSIEFGHDFDGLVLPAAALDAPIPGADPELTRYVERYAEDMLDEVHATSLEQVRERIAALLPTGACSIERLARLMGVDRRTVQRRLSADGWTFSRLVHEIRCENATLYLAKGRRSLSEVAELLGFSAHSAFTHWFRATYGCPPKQWRDGWRSPANDGRDVHASGLHDQGGAVRSRRDPTWRAFPEPGVSARGPARS